MSTTEQLFEASEFAERANVTVRALHHSDRLGLLKPSARSGAGYRLYSARDFVRLQQIVTLKFIGFPRSALIEAFTGGNQAISESLKKLYADEQNWPATFQKPYSDEVANFICQVAALSQK